MPKQSKLTVPEPTLRRLPGYLAYIKTLVMVEEVDHISSTTIATALGLDSALVAKDLSFVNLSGKTRVGYKLDNLISALEDFLGFKKNHIAYVCGVGNLGAALISDKGLQKYGLEIVGGFDVREEIIGTSIDDVPVWHIDRLYDIVYRENSFIGVLTVPIQKAQEVADLLVEAGASGIWNFTPYRVKVPDRVVLQNTSLYAHLAVMYNRLNSFSKP